MRQLDISAKAVTPPANFRNRFAFRDHNNINLRRPFYPRTASAVRFLHRQFLYDGTWMETSPSYMRQTGGWLELINTSLMDYEDPPEYKHPKTGRRLDAEAIANLCGAVQLAIGKLSETLLPDGRFVPVNDTWSDDKWQAREACLAVAEESARASRG